MRLWEEEEEEGGKDVVECEINRGGKSRESIYPPGHHPLHSDESLRSLGVGWIARSGCGLRCSFSVCCQ